jgi:protein gp37
MNKTKIEWTESTWPVVTGCSKCSEGCRLCYGARLAATRLKHLPQYAGLAQKEGDNFNWTGKVKMNIDVLGEPLRWAKPRKAFVAHTGDLFHEKVSDAFLDKVFGTIIMTCEKHIFQILTKRVERARDYLLNADRSKWIYNALNRVCFNDPDWVEAQLVEALDKNPMPRIWMGTSCENQEQADKRIPILLQIPAAVRFVSVEPMLSTVDLSKWLGYRCPECGEYGGLKVPHSDWKELGRWRFDGYNWQHHHGYPVGHIPCEHGIDWVICGGESGTNARPMHPDWVRSLRDQCKASGTPFLFKQWGEWAPRPDHLDWNESPWSYVRYGEWHATGGFVESCMCDDGSGTVYRVGKKAAGRLLDGVMHDEYPMEANNG